MRSSILGLREPSDKAKSTEGSERPKLDEFSGDSAFEDYIEAVVDWVVRQQRHRSVLTTTTAIWTWVAVVVAMGTFPPWTSRYGYSLGYSPIFAPPHGPARIDQSRLNVEWLLTAVVGAGVFLTRRG